jgi:hypothetical protein
LGKFLWFGAARRKAQITPGIVELVAVNMIELWCVQSSHDFPDRFGVHTREADGSFLADSHDLPQ